MRTVCGGSSRHTNSTAVPWTSAFSSTPRRSRCCPRVWAGDGRGSLATWHGGRGPQSHWLPLQLAQDDAWKCPHCEALQRGMVKLSLWTLPDILIIHLKRFCQVGEKRNKLSTLVRFPLSGLDMAPHVAQRGAGPPAATGPWPSWKQPACLPAGYPLDSLYDLYAVCNHHGSLQGGHYTGEPHLAARAAVVMGRDRGLSFGTPHSAQEKVLLEGRALPPPGHWACWAACAPPVPDPVLGAGAPGRSKTHMSPALVALQSDFRHRGACCFSSFTAWHHEGYTIDGICDRDKASLTVAPICQNQRKLAM